MPSTQTAVSESAYNPTHHYPTTPARKVSNPQSLIESRPFGRLPGGELVNAWVLTGSGGLKMECIDFGGIVTQLLVPDRHGKLADVILGFGNLDPYLGDAAHVGGIIGRVAGCTAGTQYRLNGRTHTVAASTPGNPAQAYNNRLWQGRVVSRSDAAPSIQFKMTSEDGDGGHPGTVLISVTYTITHNNTFLIETEAVTDKLTPFSLSHRSYFNLAGESNGTIQDHQLQIYSDEYVAVDDQRKSLGRVEALVSRGNDFRVSKTVGAALPHLFKEQGDLYRLRMSAAHGDQLRMVQAARLTHDRSGRVLDISTSSRCLQLSTAADWSGVTPGKSGQLYGKHAGICLECEGYPDGMIHPELGNILLRPGQVNCEKTEYAFSTMADTLQRVHHSTRLHTWR